MYYLICVINQILSYLDLGMFPLSCNSSLILPKLVEIIVIFDLHRTLKNFNIIYIRPDSSSEHYSYNEMYICKCFIKCIYNDKFRKLFS